MKYTHKLKMGLLATVGTMTMLSSVAHAAGTLAGTEVENSFVLNYSVSGVAQPEIDTSSGTGLEGPTKFTVDRLVNLTVATPGDTDVAPGSQDQKLVFTLTNTGNDVQAYGLSIIDETGDEFTTLNQTISYYVSDGDTEFEPDGDDGTAFAFTSATNDLGVDLTYFVVIEGDIPAGLQDEDRDSLTLLAETLEPSTAAGAGNLVVADSDNANELEGDAENVFADGKGTDNDALSDGKHSQTAAYVAASADLTAFKTVSVFSEDGAGCATIPGTLATGVQYSVPGACVEYKVTVENRGGTEATALKVNDVLPDEITFIAATTTGFTGGAFSTPSLPAANADCNGGACVVNYENATLGSGSDATPTVGVVIIRALIK